MVVQPKAKWCGVHPWVGVGKGRWGGGGGAYIFKQLNSFMYLIVYSVYQSQCICLVLVDMENHAPVQSGLSHDCL